MHKYCFFYIFTQLIDLQLFFDVTLVDGFKLSNKNIRFLSYKVMNRLESLKLAQVHEWILKIRKTNASDKEDGDKNDE